MIGKKAKTARKISMFGAVMIAVAIAILCCHSSKANNNLLLGQQTETPVYTYQIIHTYPHDQEAFTQGLVYQDGLLYEGTGLWGKSSLRRVELATGKVLQIRPLRRQYFGEGITIWQDRIVQLTWKSQVGFVYNRENFEPKETFSYSTEGWGITHDGEHLIMSDGTNTLYFLDPKTFQVTKKLQVRDRQKPIRELNELEYINGEILANIWQTEQIARISPTTGEVLGWIDLTGLYQLNLGQNGTQPDVLNGIAYDEENQRLFVTGKLWSKLFEIELVPPKKAEK